MKDLKELLIYLALIPLSCCAGLVFGLCLYTKRRQEWRRWEKVMRKRIGEHQNG